MLRLLVLLALLAPAAAAQTGAVTGRVLDGDLPLPTATVAVWQIAGPDSTLVGGATTTLDGDFRVEGVPAGTYDVVASFVGYDPARQRGVAVVGGETDLGAIRLVPSAAALGEVRVTAGRTQVQTRIDRTVYATADDPVSDGGSATDVLATLPSVDVDVDGNVSLRGAGNVAVFVNGRPAPVQGDFLASYLASLPAGSVERVEIIPNPSAAFEPDGVGGVINIVLKQNTDRGVGGTVSAGTDSNGGLDGTAAVTYGKGPWSLAATVGLRDDVRPGSGDGFRINRYDTDPTTRTEEEAGDRTRTSALVNLSADYALSRATTLTSQLQLGTRAGDETEIGQTLVQGLDGAPVFGFGREVTEVDDGRSLDARLGLVHQFGEGHRLTVEGRAEASQETEDSAYLETLLDGAGDLTPARRSSQDDSDREASVQIDYTRALGTLRLDAGYKGDWQALGSTLAAETAGADGVFVTDLDQSNTFDFDQSVQALYVQAGGEWGGLGAQVGLRAEQATTTFDLLTSDETYENDYASLFPSAFLSFAPSDATTFKASYSRRVNRPRTRALNPFPSFDDPLNIRQGNPALQPEYVSSFEAGVTQFVPWGSVSLTPYYRHTTNVIRRFLTIRDDGVTVRTFENLDTSDSYGVELVSSFEDVGGLSGYASLEGFRLKTDGTTTSTGDVASDGFSWGGRLNATYDLGDRLGLGGLALQTTARYSAPIETEQARIDSRVSVDLALRQKLLDDRASLTVQLRDPFNQSGFAYTLDQPELFQELSRTWGGRQVGVTLSYTFGQQARTRDRDPGERDGGDFDGGDEF
ncbi:TonB-dependent receptor domain-containing protein [Rubrivirga sp. IMCC45206]|uniref:TonB-dependent receptor domain-containing protein n=1 Tax=Rubrivirga sp. IMCC45206 TaxID=3391614 RepID=UPI00398FAA4A